MKLGVAFPSAAVTLLGLSMSASAAEGSTDRELVFLNAEAGSEYLGLQTLKANCAAPSADCGLVDTARVKSKDFGAMYGAGLGVRLSAFTLGSRFRYGDFSDWQLWTLDAEAGVHVPIGRRRIADQGSLALLRLGSANFSACEQMGQLRAAVRAQFGVDADGLLAHGVNGVPSSAATSLFEKPCATQAATWRSRGDSRVSRLSGASVFTHACT